MPNSRRERAGSTGSGNVIATLAVSATEPTTVNARGVNTGRPARRTSTASESCCPATSNRKATESVVVSRHAKRTSLPRAAPSVTPRGAAAPRGRTGRPRSLSSYRGTRSGPHCRGPPRASRCGSRCRRARRPAPTVTVRAAGTLIHHDARAERIAGAQEARQRRSREQRTRHEQRRLAVAVAVAGRDRDRHDANRRQFARQLRRGDGGAGGVGLDGAEKEGGRGKSRAQDVAARQAATAARLGFAPDRRALLLQYLRRHRHESARA